MNEPRTIRLIIMGVAVLIIIAILSQSTFLTIRPGEKGVIFRPFSGGLDKENVHDQGFEIIAPWNEMIIYNVKETQIEESMDIISSNGLSIAVDISMRFHPIYTKIGYLHEKFGVNYLNELAVPELRSGVRKVLGRYTPEELYSTKREQVQTEIYNETDTIMSKNFIQLRAMLIRSVKLPASIQGAIENKLKQEQEALEYEFKLQKEKKEADRKRIEAQGINDFQRIVSEGISDKLLKWKGIEATQDLAKSQNTKIVVIGSGESGLPIILGGDK